MFLVLVKQSTSGLEVYFGVDIYYSRCLLLQFVDMKTVSRGIE